MLLYAFIYLFMCHDPSDYFPAFHRGEPGLMSGQEMCDLWQKKWQ